MDHKTIYKTLHKTDQQKTNKTQLENACFPKLYAMRTPLVASVVLIWLQTRS